MIFCIEESAYKIRHATSHFLDRPEMLKPFIVDNEYNSFYPVILFSRKLDAVGYYNKVIIPSSIGFVSMQIANYKIKLNPNNYRKIEGYEDIVESKFSKLPQGPELWNLIDLQEILDDKLTLLKNLQNGYYNLSCESDLIIKEYNNNA